MIKQIISYIGVLLFIGIVVYIFEGLKFNELYFWQIVAGVALFRTLEK